MESIVSTQDDSSGKQGREARFGAYHATERNISFGTWQVVSSLSECLQWLCQDPAVMEEEGRRNGRKSRGARAQPHCCSLGSGTLTWAYPQGEGSLPFFMRKGDVQEGMGGRQY